MTQSNENQVLSNKFNACVRELIVSNIKFYEQRGLSVTASETSTDQEMDALEREALRLSLRSIFEFVSREAAKGLTIDSDIEALSRYKFEDQNGLDDFVAAARTWLKF